MDSVNKVIWRFCLPILVIFYIIYLAYDSYDYKNKKLMELIYTSSYVSQQITNISKSKEIDGVILGGSNSAFSLSANIFNAKSYINWINLSLMYEGYSDKGYWDFIENNLSENRRQKVSKVIYSSVSPLRDKSIILNRKKTISNLYSKEVENKSFPSLLIPYKSIASHLKEFFLEDQITADKLNIKRGETATLGSLEGISTNVGDFDFSHFKCDLTGLTLAFKRNLDEKEVVAWVNRQLTTLVELFPNATLYFVVPSEFYGTSLIEEDAALSDKILSDAVNSFNNKVTNKVVFIRQPFYPSKNLLCDAINHSNDLGRTWRTNKLIEQMLKFR